MPGFRPWNGPAARRPGRAGIPAISRSGAGRSSSLPPPDMRGTTATATSRATGISLPPSLRGRSGTTRSSRLPCRSRPAPVSACWWRPERTAQVVRSASCMRRASSAPTKGTRRGRCSFPTRRARARSSRLGWPCASPGNSTGGTKGTDRWRTFLPASTPSGGTCCGGRWLGPPSRGSRSGPCEARSCAVIRQDGRRERTRCTGARWTS